MKICKCEKPSLNAQNYCWNCGGYRYVPLKCGEYPQAAPEAVSECMNLLSAERKSKALDWLEENIVYMAEDLTEGAGFVLGMKHHKDGMTLLEAVEKAMRT